MYNSIRDEVILIKESYPYFVRRIYERRTGHQAGKVSFLVLGIPLQKGS